MSEAVAAGEAGSVWCRAMTTQAPTHLSPAVHSRSQPTLMLALHSLLHPSLLLCSSGHPQRYCVIATLSLSYLTVPAVNLLGKGKGKGKGREGRLKVKSCSQTRLSGRDDQVGRWQWKSHKEQICIPSLQLQHSESLSQI